MRLRCLALSALLSSLCYPAQAEDAKACTPSDAPNAEEEARTAFDEGRAAYQNGDYEGALEKFERAHGVSCHPTLRQAVADAREHLGRLREALEDNEAIVNDPRLTESQRAEVTAAILRLQQSVGMLVVRGSPQGARVMIDGKESCQLPCRVRIDPATHDIEVRHGDQIHRTKITVAAGATVPLEVHLGRAPTPPAPIRRPAKARAPQREDDSSSGHVFWLTGIGVGLAVIGAAGVIGFGLRTKDIEEEYSAEPIVDHARKEGTLARDLTNASIAVGSAGLACIAIDLILYAVEPSPEKRNARFETGAFRLSF